MRSADTTAVVAPRLGRYTILRLALPAEEPVNIGILLEDPQTDALHIRLRRDWEEIAPDETEVLEAMERDIREHSVREGARRLLSEFEERLSNTIQLTDPANTLVEDFDRALNRLYRQHVSSTVHRFVTHLPLYSLKAAAGPFLENAEVEPSGWEEAPPQLRLPGRAAQEMFVAQVQGRSMEPLIPDGALCVFRRNVTGSRNGKLVLVEALGGGTNDQYTVKRYVSSKIQRLGDSWEHAAILLEPLNPEFQPWYLSSEENRYRIIAEFVQTLD